MITARGQLVAGREHHPLPGLARQLFRGPSLEDAWDSATGVGLKLDLKQSDPVFLDQVVEFLSPRAGSRSVMVSSPDRATLLLLHDRFPSVQLLYSADNFAAVQRLQSDPALVAAVTGTSAYHDGVVDATLLRWAHAHDLKVIAWTVNDGKRLAQLTRLGADGITRANLAVLRSLGGP